jgi:hypothetical protein
MTDDRSSANGSEGPASGGDDSRLSIVEKLVDPGEEEGLLSSRMAEVESSLVSIGQALGGDVAPIAAQPITQESGTDEIPEPP